MNENPDKELILEDFLPYRLAILSHTVSSLIARVYDKRFGLTIPEWRVIAIVGRFPGLEGSGLLLQNDGVDVLAVDADGAFAFMRGVEDGAGYTVRVMTQPREPDQSCVVSNAADTVAGADVTGVTVVCATP